jgi:hypothetical protein
MSSLIKGFFFKLMLCIRLRDISPKILHSGKPIIWIYNSYIDMKVSIFYRTVSEFWNVEYAYIVTLIQRFKLGSNFSRRHLGLFYS